VDGDSNYQIGLLAPIYWNLSYDPKKKIPYIPVSKSWVGMMTEIMETGDSQIDKPGENIRSTRDDGPMIFNWDSALAAMSLSHFDTHLAQKLITGLLSYQKKNGSIPHLIVKDKKTNLVNPPIIFLACMKVFLYSQNYNFLKEVYPQLVRYFDYLMDYRKGNEEYRMAWGAPAEDRTYPGLTGKTGAAYESGMENSPAWDGAQYDTETGTMNLNSVGFTAVMGLASSIMSKISEVLNNNRNKKKFEEHNNQFRRSLLKYFFDPKTQTFRNRYFDGTFSKVQTPDSFFPLFTGKMGHSFTDESYALLHEDKAFANEYMIPSLRRDHPDFDPDGDSWCGRILPPLNYLVHLALITQGNTKESFDLAVNSFNMFHKEYVEHGHVHENYSALTGRGNPAEKTYARSCPFYTWGNLMPLMLLEEIFDVGWNYRLNFGSHFLKNKVEFKNIKVGNTYYSVSCKPQETLLRKNQSELISASPAARFTEFQADWETVKFRLFGNGLTTVKLFQVGDRVEIYVRINNKPAHYINMPRKGPITFDVKADPHVPLNITVFFKR
jgi:glycogen debranching enzyme